MKKRMISVKADTKSRYEYNYQLNNDRDDDSSALRGHMETMEQIMMVGAVGHYSTESPLSREIREYVPCKSRTIPKMSCYHGKTDPFEHVTQFERRVQIAGSNRSTTCQLCEVYFKDCAQGWYMTLLP